MHSDQLHVDSTVVTRLIADQFPEWRDEAVIELSVGGTVNAIFRVGSGLSARFPLRAGNSDAVARQLEEEARASAELAKWSPVATPTPVAIGRPGFDYTLPWSVQTWIPGHVATPDGLAESHAFAEDLASLIRALRGADTEGRRFTGSGRGGVLTDHDEWMQTCFRESEALLDTPRLRRLWAELRELPAAGADVMSHGDLIPANLLVESGRLVGVLDGGGFGPADPALDLVSGWHLLDAGTRETLRRSLECEQVEWLRGKAWAFEQAMGLVWYYRETNPGMSALGRSTLARILDDSPTRNVI